MERLSNFIKMIFGVNGIGIISLVLCVTTSYLNERDSNEIINNNLWGVGLLNNISASIFAAYIFYLFQQYLYERRRRKVVNPIIVKRISYIIVNMDKAIYELSNVYIKNHVGTDFSDDDLHLMLKLNFDDESTISDAASLLTGQCKKIVMRDWLLQCSSRVESEIDRLYRHYGSDIPLDLNDILESIISSKYHTMLIEYAKWRVPMSFEKCNDEIIADYWHLRNKLLRFKEDMSKTI